MLTREQLIAKIKTIEEFAKQDLATEVADLLTRANKELAAYDSAIKANDLRKADSSGLMILGLCSSAESLATFHGFAKGKTTRSDLWPWVGIDARSARGSGIARQ